MLRATKVQTLYLYLVTTVHRVFVSSCFYVINLTCNTISFYVVSYATLLVIYL